MKFFKLTSLLVTIAASASIVEAIDDSALPSPINFLRRIQQLFGPPQRDIIVVLNDNDRRLDNGADITSRKTIADIALEKRNAAADVAQSLNVVPEHKYGASIYGFSTRGVTPKKIAQIKNDPRVDYVEIDQVVQLDPIEMTPEDDEGGRKLRGRRLAPKPGKGKPGDGDSNQPSEETPWGITRVGGPIDGSENTAWVLDTGIDLDHPDLNVDSSRGFNAFTSGKDGRSLDDENGHGTHVAGTIAAIGDNGIGVVGVAANATVVPVKVLSSRGSGSYSGVIAGIDHVGANGSDGDVANMSLGGGFSQAVNKAVIAASTISSVKFVLAAGNSGDEAKYYSPASANGDNIYTISASDSNDNFAYFSNYGNPPVDFCAPGVSIKSTWKGGGYNTISGTSMAAPHAAGVLLLGNANTCTNADGKVFVNGDPDKNADPIICHST